MSKRILIHERERYTRERGRDTKPPTSLYAFWPWAREVLSSRNVEALAFLAGDGTVVLGLSGGQTPWEG